jgi:hypothetical protein
MEHEERHDAACFCPPSLEDGWDEMTVDLLDRLSGCRAGAGKIADLGVAKGTGSNRVREFGVPYCSC